MATRLPYGLRRYPLMVVIFVGFAAVVTVWASRIDKPTFVFPLGRLEPDDARIALFATAALLGAYVAVMTYIRFVRRPRIVLEKGKLTVPLGEFGLRTLTLHRGEVLHVVDETTRGGWRVARVRHAAGTLAIWSSQLASDADYDRVRRKLDALR